MSGANDVAASLVTVADQIARLHAAMSAAPWVVTRAGGDAVMPGTLQVETGADHWIAFPNADGAVRSDGGALRYAEPVGRRLRLDASGIITCRNRLGDVVTLLRLAAAEIDRLEGRVRPDRGRP